MRKRAAGAAVLASGVLIAALLTGCASDNSAGSGGATSTPTPTASKPTPTPTVADDVLFTITANARASDGSIIGIQLTAHDPVAYSKAEAKPLIAEFVKACGAGVGGVPVTAESLQTNGASLMKIDIASSVVGKQFGVPLELSLGSPYFGQAVTGKSVTPIDSKNPCYGGFNWSSSGTLSVVADFESGNPGPDLTAWRYAIYGFAVQYGSNATIEACRVTITDRAKKAGTANVTGWDPSQAATGTTCAIGYAGE